MPCALCGHRHRVRIHALLVRKIRTGEEENTEILIVSIYCDRARKRGRQYTKRIHPAFVIPRCTITLENVLRYVSKHTEGEMIDYDEASYLLGSYDSRTIRKHIQAAWRMLRKAKSRLSKRSPGLRSPRAAQEAESVISEWQQVELLLKEASTATGRTTEQRADALEPIVVIHAMYVRFGSGRVRRGATAALGRACPAPAGCDTS